MKKSILVLCLACITFSLMAFGYINWNHSTTGQKTPSCNKKIDIDFNLSRVEYKKPDIDLVYNIDSRFIARITKENLHSSKSIIDILPKKATKSIVSYQSSEVYLLNQDKETSEAGNSDILNTAQLRLLQSIDYSNNILIKANYSNQIINIGSLGNNNLTYYITVIPENEAEFSGGKEELITYLRESSKAATSIIKRDQLKPGKVNFTITKSGTISNVKLESTSGYPSVDNVLVDIVKKMPEKWNPATNANGEKVDQELVFFFGLEGC